MLTFFIYCCSFCCTAESPYNLAGRFEIVEEYYTNIFYSNFGLHYPLVIFHKITNYRVNKLHIYILEYITVNTGVYNNSN